MPMNIKLFMKAHNIHRAQLLSVRHNMTPVKRIPRITRGQGIQRQRHQSPTMN